MPTLLPREEWILLCLSHHGYPSDIVRFTAEKGRAMTASRSPSAGMSMLAISNGPVLARSGHLLAHLLSSARAVNVRAHLGRSLFQRRLREVLPPVMKQSNWDAAVVSPSLATSSL